MNEFFIKLKSYYYQIVYLVLFLLITIATLWTTQIYIGEYKIPSEQNGTSHGNVLFSVAKANSEGDESSAKHFQSVPVLIYHYVRDGKSNNDLVMPKIKFREEMKYLKDNNYTSLTLDQLYSCFENNTPIPEKSVVITIDDGDRDIYTNAYPILKEFNLKATVFMITSFIDKRPDYLTSTQLIELQKNGIDIESHTANHEKLDELTLERQMITLQSSKDALEKLLNKEVKYIAYPYGSYNEDTIAAAQKTGYKMAFSGIRGFAGKLNGIYELRRIYIGRMDSMHLFKKVLVGNFSK